VYQREIEGFEPCYRGQGNHAVRDDVVLDVCGGGLAKMSLLHHTALTVPDI
jgi:hypothetical protein